MGMAMVKIGEAANIVSVTPARAGLGVPLATKRKIGMY
jgi:hypothetical protein